MKSYKLKTLELLLSLNIVSIVTTMIKPKQNVINYIIVKSTCTHKNYTRSEIPSVVAVLLSSKMLPAWHDVSKKARGV